MPSAFLEAGYQKGLIPPPPAPTDPADPYMAVLNRIEAKLDVLNNGLKSYYR